jgi:hypothetical protein
VANRRGFLKFEGRPRIGGIIYAETARKVAYFVETAERLGQPLVYLQDVSGFMVGLEAEREGIIRAGAEMVESMSCTSVPKIVLTLNHASGAGYYAMAGQGFDPNFTFNWPTGRIGVMEGESAIQALYAAELEKHKGGPLPAELELAIRKTRADYERWLDSRYAAARGHCDAVIDPLETRRVLTCALEACLEGLPAPETVPPWAVTPEVATPGAVTPGAAAPGATPGAVAAGTTPGGATPEAATPGAVASAAVMTGAVTPGSAMPGAATPGPVAPWAVTPGAPLP